MSKGTVFAAWDDAPHLDEQSKKDLAASYLPHEVDARTKGIPSLGSGAIYPVPESDIVCEPFVLPAWYKMVYGMDVGWNRTAVIWGALDDEHDTLYLVDEYYRGQAEPAIHAQAIKDRGAWIPGAIDPNARGRGQKDGSQLFADYCNLGLLLTPADNTTSGPESGILKVWRRLTTQRMKVFRTCSNWLGEYRIYRRNDKGAIVKEDDHLMDATKYLVATGLDIAAIRPRDEWDGRPGMPVRGRSRHTFDHDPFAEVNKP